MNKLKDVFVVTSEYCANITRVVGVLTDEKDIDPFVKQYIRDHHSRLSKVKKDGKRAWIIEDPDLMYSHLVRVFVPDYS